MDSLHSYFMVWRHKSLQLGELAATYGLSKLFFASGDKRYGKVFLFFPLFTIPIRRWNDLHLYQNSHLDKYKLGMFILGL